MDFGPILLNICQYGGEQASEHLTPANNKDGIPHCHLTSSPVNQESYGDNLDLRMAASLSTDLFSTTVASSCSSTYHTSGCSSGYSAPIYEAVQHFDCGRGASCARDTCSVDRFIDFGDVPSTSKSSNCNGGGFKSVTTSTGLRDGHIRTNCPTSAQDVMTTISCRLDKGATDVCCKSLENDQITFDSTEKTVRRQRKVEHLPLRGSTRRLTADSAYHSSSNDASDRGTNSDEEACMVSNRNLRCSSNQKCSTSSDLLGLSPSCTTAPIDTRPLSLTSTLSSFSSHSSSGNHNINNNISSQRSSVSGSQQLPLCLEQPEILGSSSCSFSDDKNVRDSALSEPHLSGTSISSNNANVTLTTPESSNNNGFYLKRIITEMVETERSYVNDLQATIEGYLGFFMRKRMELQITPLEICNLFGNIEEIFEFNKNFYLDLEKANMDLSKVSTTFIKHVDGFSVYTEYCTGYSKMLGALECLMERPLIAEALKKRQFLLHHSLPLGAFLLKPVQRILKYHLFWQNMLKYCDEEQTEAVQKVLKSMTAIAQHINDVKRRHEHAVRVCEIQCALQNWEKQEVDDLSQYGELILEGSFRVHGAKNTRHVFLFEEVLLITKRKSDGSLMCKDFIMCSNLMLIESVVGDFLAFHVLPFDSPKTQHTLQARTLEQKKEWTREIKRLIMEHFPSEIPTHAREIVMQIGNDLDEEAVLAERLHQPSSKKQHPTPKYLEKRRKSSDSHNHVLNVQQKPHRKYFRSASGGELMLGRTTGLTLYSDQKKANRETKVEGFFNHRRCSAESRQNRAANTSGGFFNDARFSCPTTTVITEAAEETCSNSHHREPVTLFAGGTIKGRSLSPKSNPSISVKPEFHRSMIDQLQPVVTQPEAGYSTPQSSVSVVAATYANLMIPVCCSEKPSAKNGDECSAAVPIYANSDPLYDVLPISQPPVYCADPFAAKLRRKESMDSAFESRSETTTTAERQKEVGEDDVFGSMAKTGQEDVVNRQWIMSRFQPQLRNDALLRYRNVNSLPECMFGDIATSKPMPTMGNERRDRANLTKSLPCSAPDDYSKPFNEVGFGDSRLQSLEHVDQMPQDSTTTLKDAGEAVLDSCSDSGKYSSGYSYSSSSNRRNCGVRRFPVFDESMWNVACTQCDASSVNRNEKGCANKQCTQRADKDSSATSADVKHLGETMRQTIGSLGQKLSMPLSSKSTINNNNNSSDPRKIGCRAVYEKEKGKSDSDIRMHRVVEKGTGIERDAFDRLTHLITSITGSKEAINKNSANKLKGESKQGTAIALGAKVKRIRPPRQTEPTTFDLKVKRPTSSTNNKTDDGQPSMRRAGLLMDSDDSSSDESHYESSFEYDLEKYLESQDLRCDSAIFSDDDFDLLGITSLTGGSANNNITTAKNAGADTLYVSSFNRLSSQQIVEDFAKFKIGLSDSELLNTNGADNNSHSGRSSRAAIRSAVIAGSTQNAANAVVARRRRSDKSPLILERTQLLLSPTHGKDSNQLLEEHSTLARDFLGSKPVSERAQELKRKLLGQGQQRRTTDAALERSKSTTVSAPCTPQHVKPVAACVTVPPVVDDVLFKDGYVKSMVEKCNSAK